MPTRVQAGSPSRTMRCSIGPLSLATSMVQSRTKEAQGPQLSGTGDDTLTGSPEMGWRIVGSLHAARVEARDPPRCLRGAYRRRWGDLRSRHVDGSGGFSPSRYGPRARSCPVGTQALEVGQRGSPSSSLDQEPRGPDPDHDGEIAAGDAASTERLCDALVCGWVNGEEHQARSGRVESMVEAA